jgi:hypothetical protein
VMATNGVAIINNAYLHMSILLVWPYEGNYLIGFSILSLLTRTLLFLKPPQETQIVYWAVSKMKRVFTFALTAFYDVFPLFLTTP